MLLGPRQVGKTTLCETILSQTTSENEIVRWTGDSITDRVLLSVNDLANLRTYTDNKKIIFIDEAQKIENIGNTLKLLVDFYKDTKQIIITGSSSINLIDNTAEPLTGRKSIFLMYPISMSEILLTHDRQALEGQRTDLMVFGSYPGVLQLGTREEKISLLKELANSSLYRDILEFQQVRNSDVIMRLLRLLAFQIGQEVSMNELATQLGIDTKTVERYIDLLEKSYIIFRLPPYFTNKRKEISKSKKIYFYDLGIRNTIIGDWNPLMNRQDVWLLWENMMMIERMKQREYLGKYALTYFWRTNNWQEIDLIEENAGELHAYEFKWWDKKVSVPTSFWVAYPNNTFELINQSNYLQFVLGKI